MPYKDKEKNREYQKKWQQNNKEKVAEKSKKYYQANKEKLKEYSKKYNESNKERIKERQKNYYQANKEKIKEYRREYKKEYYQANKDKVYEYQREKYYTDPCYKLRKNTSRLVRMGLKEGKGGQSMLPYVDWNSYEELKEHIESQFEDWMTWDNYGEWHIDHIKPQSVLLEGVTSMDDPKFRECWALENLRPLEARENISKGNKVL